MKRAILASCLLLQAVTGSASDSELGPYPARVTVRHIEPNGIGYKQGYTTLEGFFAPGVFLLGWLEVFRRALGLGRQRLLRLPEHASSAL